MKTKVLLVFSLFLLARISTAQYVTIPDANFRGFLKQSYPTCFNSQDMMDTTCTAVLTARMMNCSMRQIANLQGIQYFKGLNRLDCYTNWLISLPVFPSRLDTLHCEGNQLTSLPALPNSLTYLRCSENFALTSLPALPSALRYLNCGGTKLTNLPVLPSGLETLSCNNNVLSISLPVLPSALKYLSCNNAQLNSLPTLPSILKYLDCANNVNLTILPVLPSTLTYLNCGADPLSNLPALPSTLTYLSCYSNQLTSLPALPSALTWLDCNNNAKLSCLPNLPSGLNFLNESGTLITCLPNKPAGITSTLPICISPCVLGIESSSEEVHLAVAPNPATETCRVEFDTRGKLGTLTLTDALGRTVKSVALQGSGQHNFSVADMPAGLYYLRVNTEGQVLASGKLVIEK